VIVETVSVPGEESSVDDGEVLGVCRRRIAQPAEPRNLQLIPLDVVLQYELAGQPPPLPQIQSMRQGPQFS